MPRNFRSVNKKSVQLDVFYGWDVDVKQWFIDIKMTGFTGGNLIQWFNSESTTSNHIPVGLIISTIIFFELIIVVGGWKYKPELSNPNTNQISNEISNTHSLGQVLYTDYIHIFQISGMILLISMIGAIVLTFRQRAGVKKQSYLKQISRERSEGVEVLEVASNKGVKIDD